MEAFGVAITGASSGIGAALALKLARPGSRLALVGRNEVRLAEVVASCRQRGASCAGSAMDIRESGKLAAVLTQFAQEGPIDLLIVNAGILDGRRHGHSVELPGAARNVLTINLLAAVETIHMVLPEMIARRRGGIILVSSLAAFVPLPDAPAYSASKAGLLSYGLALREAVSTEGVTVTVACPGFVSTAMARRHLGPRPGEVSAEVAADRILTAWQKNRSLVGFPIAPSWLSRLSLLVPELVRRYAMRGTRFHVSS
jgi:short-subunit dehydrogenase